MREFTQEEKDAIVQDALSGATIQDLSDLYNCDEGDIDHLCKTDLEIGKTIRSAKAKIRMLVRKRLLEISMNDFDQRSAYCAIAQLAKNYLREDAPKKKGRKKGEEVDLDELSDEEVDKLLAESESKYAEYAKAK